MVAMFRRSCMHSFVWPQIFSDKRYRLQQDLNHLSLKAESNDGQQLWVENGVIIDHYSKWNYDWVTIHHWVMTHGLWNAKLTEIQISSARTNKLVCALIQLERTQIQLVRGLIELARSLIELTPALNKVLY